MKKFLSLVLALVMTMSLVTISAGAKDFTDGSEITYKEAVDVISGLGIVDGYDGGSFQPTTTLTRGAAAKIICNMILGPTTASTLSADAAPFVDVPANHVFAGYIAYCANQNIINGYPDGTFRPAGTLNGFAFMKMLLGALGYDGSVEGYTGANWTINVGKQAVGIGLDDDLTGEFLGTKSVTREEACLYAFNTLQATMVSYDNNLIITDGNLSTSSKSGEMEQGSYKSYNGDEDDKLQFCERYFKDLKLTDGSNDLKQPTNKWKLKSEVIAEYAKSADATAVVADKDKTINDILTSSSYMDYSSSDLKAGTNYYVNAADKTKTTGLTKGDVVYAYEDGDGKVDTVVVAHYTYAKIDSVSESMSSTEKDNGAAYRLKLVDIDDNNVGTYYDSYDDSSKYELPGFDADTYEEDVVLAVAQNGKAIVDSYVAESVSGKPTSVKAVENGNITIGGTKYNYAGEPAGNFDNIDFDKEYDVFTTAEGYVIAIDGAGSANLEDIYYVSTIYNDKVGGELRYYAQRVSTEGKVETVEVEKGALQIIESNVELQNATGKSDDISVGTAGAGLYTFSDKKVASETVTGGDTDSQKSGNEIYTIKPFDDSDVADDFDSTGAVTDDIKMKSGDSTLKLDGKTYYLNEETVYLAVEGIGSKIDVTTAIGGLKVTADGAKTYVVTDESDSKTARLVVVTADSLSSSATTEDVVYLAGDASQKTSSSTYTTDDLWIMKDLSNPAGVTITDDATDQGFYTYSMKDDAYKLEDADELDLVAAYDDESGYMAGLVVESVYNKSGRSYVTFTDANSYLDDVKFNGTTIIDTRGSSDIDDSVYDTEITTIADLKDAVETAGSVTVDVYFDNGVTFLAVTEVGEGYEIDASNFDAVGEAVNGLYIDDVAAKAAGGAEVTVTLTGTATAAKTMQLKDADGNVLGSVDVDVDDTSAEITFTMPNADVELTLAEKA